MKLIFSSAAAVALLAGCATPPPSGPSVMVLPGSTKSFDQFRFDDNECRQFASSQIGGTTAAQAQTDSAVKSAVVGTAIGAAAGGLMGGNSGAGVCMLSALEDVAEPRADHGGVTADVDLSPSEVELCELGT